MPTGHAAYGGNPLYYLIPIVVVLALVLLRSRAPRRLRPELLWIAPTIYGVIALFYFGFGFRPASLAEGLGVLGAAVLGVALGWWRGKLTRIQVHPETHDVTAQISPIGALVIVLVFFGRYALGYFAPADKAAAINAGLIAFAVCVVLTARVEMWLRSRQLLTTAKAAA
jgi:hypothetical protein